jgi:hypothetical protein
MIRIALALVLLVPPLAPQDRDVKLPSGKSQNEEILKLEHKKNLEDVARMSELCRDLETELKEKGHSVLSATALKNTEEIERLAKRIRGRLRRY